MPKMFSENNPNKKLIGDKEYYYNQKNYNKTYYEKNKDKLLEKTECKICNKFVRKSGMSSHKKSKYCLFASKFVKPEIIKENEKVQLKIKIKNDILSDSKTENS